MEQLLLTGGAEPVGPSQDTDKRYTPPWLCSTIRDAQKVKAFDLDPCSDVVGNRNVKALTFYTFAEDGLANPWFGSMYVNWPFSDPLPWMQYLVKQWNNPNQLFGPIKQVTVLARCDMSTRWAKEALRFFDLVCHPSNRICFDGCKGSPDFTCVLFHKGGDLAHWAKVMKAQVGPVLKVI